MNRQKVAYLQQENYNVSYLKNGKNDQSDPLK